MLFSSIHRSSQRPHVRRQGQALIIAVLVMLLAALLSSAFLVLVANQGQITGRAFERDLARSTAQKGFNQVTALIKASPDSDDWQAEAQPSLVGLRSGNTVIDPTDLPPGIGDVDYDFYWSPLDKAEGWALNLKYTATDLPGRLAELAAYKRQGGRVFVKVPNPLLNRRQIPSYMIESRLLDQASDEVTDGGDKKFMLRVTVIGLSPRGDSSWARQTFYKPTNYNGAAFSYAQFVSNYSISSSTFLTAPVVATGTLAAGTQQVVLKVLSTKFSASDFPPGRQLILSDSTGQVTSVTVTNDPATLLSYDPTTQKLTFTPTSIALDGASTIVSATGTMMNSPFSLDPDGVAGNSALATGPDKLATGVGSNLTTDTSNFGNGYCFNLGLTLRGQDTIGLRPPYARNQGGLATYSGQNALLVTGPVNVTQTTGSADAASGISPIKIVNTTQTSPTPLAVPTSAPADNRYLRVGFDATGNPRRDTFLSQTDPLLTPRSVVPPALNFDGVNKSYKKLAEGSDAVLGPLGYGDGVYIDNTTDKESFTGVGNLTASQLQRLWQRKSFPVTSGGNITTGSAAAIVPGINGARLCYARPGFDSYAYPMASGGLEAQGLRGWISPWEFLPRGTQIILDGANQKITIIRDPLDASGAISDTKAWKNADGSVNPNRPFKMVIDVANNMRMVGGGQTVAFTQSSVPFNGIIAAEGNLRVRGDWSASAQPLTIVSNNNIYIEGSTVGQAGKLALLAKQNVVVNPTQLVLRPEGLVDRAVGGTAITNATGTGTADLTVGTAITRFALGQLVSVGDSGQPYSVIALDTATQKITLSGGTFTGTNLEVRQICDPAIVQIHPFVDTTVTPNVTSLVEVKPTDMLPVAGGRWAYAWKKRGDTLLRQFPNGMMTPRLNIEQGAQRIDVAFRAKRASSVYTLKNRDTATPKRMQGTITPTATPDPTPNPTPIENFDVDIHDLTPIMGATPTSTPVATDGDTNATLGTLKTRLETSPTPSANPTYAPNWEVAFPTATPDPNPTATPIPGATATPEPYASVPVRRLSAASTTVTTGATPATTDTMQIPLLPSVGVLFDAVSNSNPVLTFINTIGSWFGLVSSPVTSGVDDKEIAATIPSTFMSDTMKWNSIADPNFATETGYTLGTSTGGTLALQRDTNDPQSLLPTYYVSGWHWENPNDTATTITPASAVAIQATIYAESGSWFVIPQPAMTAQDTTATDANKAFLYRPFTQIVVNSSIAQGYSPTADLDYDAEPDPEGRQFGATKTWLDALARATVNTSGAPSAYDVIQYGALPIPANLPPDQRVNLPSSGDVLYTYIS